MAKQILSIFALFFAFPYAHAGYQEPTIDIIQSTETHHALEKLQDEKTSSKARVAYLKQLDIILQKSLTDSPNDMKNFEGNAVISSLSDPQIYEDVTSVILKSLSQIYAKDKTLLDNYSQLGDTTLSELESDLQNKTMEKREDVLSKGLIYLVTDEGFPFFERAASQYLEEGSYKEALTYFELLKKYSHGFYILKKTDKLEFLAKLGFLYDKLYLHDRLLSLFLENPWELSTFDILQLPKDFKFKTLLKELNHRTIYQDTVGRSDPDIEFPLAKYDSYTHFPSDPLEPIQMKNNRICKKDDNPWPPWCYEGDGIEFLAYLDMTGDENKVYALARDDGESESHLHIYDLYVIEENTGKFIRKQRLGSGTWKEPGFIYRDNFIYILTEEFFLKLDFEGSLIEAIRTAAISNDALRNLTPGNLQNFMDLNIGYVVKRWNRDFSLHINSIFMDPLASHFYKDAQDPSDLPRLCRFFIDHNASEFAMIGIKKMIENLYQEKNFNNRSIISTDLSRLYRSFKDSKDITHMNEMMSYVETYTALEQKRNAEIFAKSEIGSDYHRGKLSCMSPVHIGALLIDYTADTADGRIAFSCTDEDTGIEYALKIWGIGVSATFGMDWTPKIYYEGYGDMLGQFTGVQLSFGVDLGGNFGVYTNGKMRYQFANLSLSLGASLSLLSFMQVSRVTPIEEIESHSMAALLVELKKIR